jgi:penicillin-binding protein 2
MLMRIQIAGETQYRTEAIKRTAPEISVTSARGEIVDRYGRAIAKNRLGYSVVFTRAQLPKGKENETIWRLTNLLSEMGEEWIDTCPIVIDKNGYASFTDETLKTVDKMKTKLQLQKYATAQNCLDTMCADYELDGIPIDVARTIMGVRLEMDLAAFSSSNPYTFATDISLEAMQKIKENSATLKGVDIVVVPIREYADGTIAPHIIGNTGPIFAEEYEQLSKMGYKMTDIVGRFGIESKYESELKGTDGRKKVKRDDDGNIVYEEYTRDAQPGNTIVLTIDSELQKLAQKSLGNTITSIAKKGGFTTGRDADSGAVVVMNCRTFEVLALVTYPSFNLSSYNEDYDSLVKVPAKPLFNRALNGIYAPGSTFKPSVALAGLQEGVITRSSMITCNKKYVLTEYNNFTLRCLGTHGSINVTTALSKSCNVFFYHTGYELGITRLNDYCRQLGLGVVTGVGLGESKGVLAGREERESREENWFAADTLTAAIGQNDNRFTPMQLCAYIATIANGGTRYESRIIKTIKSFDYSKTILEDTSDRPKILNNLNVQPINLKYVKEGLLSVTQEGTASAVFSNYGVRVGGKTGTAETTKTATANAIFLAFAPYDNPEIAIAIIGEKCGHGSEMTQTARDIFDEYFFSEKTSGYEMLPDGQIVK